MSLETNLLGRLRNTTLPRTHALLPLFESVVNSIHACEEVKDRNISKGEITVQILREPKENSQLSFSENKKVGPEALPRIVGFKIFDNGIGFNDSNMESFQTLDSDYKKDKGCRGIGRLLWLKAFREVRITSNYIGTLSEKYQRKFSFTKERGIFPPSPEGKKIQKDSDNYTIVELIDFYSIYQKHASKTVHKIASALLEHCLWYFIRSDGRPVITIIDGEESVSLDTLFDTYTLGNIESDSFNIKSQCFDLTYIKVRNQNLNNHEICYCAANRLVKRENITNKIPGLYKRLSDGAGQFSYLCFVTSPYLDEKVRSERTEFDISYTRKKESSLFDQDWLTLSDDTLDDELVFEEITNTVLEKIAYRLSEILKKNQDTGKKRIEEFISMTAPKYRPIMKHFPELSVDPDMSDKELDLILYKQLSKLERDLISSGHDLSIPKDEEMFSDYKKRLDAYMSKVNDVKMSNLAGYVFHRKVIIDFFENIIGKYRDGKFPQERVIHQLIMPMQVESDDVRFDDSNLWLIDERLSFHNFLASDKSLLSMPITSAKDRLEPDIISLMVYDNQILINEGKQLPLASINVIEIKRPMRNDYSEGEDHDPIQQSLQYIKKIREGQATTKNGRLIPQSKDIPAFCYILADLTPKMKDRAEYANLKIASDYMGYFGYNENHKAYIEIISFDKLITTAKQRNRAFFDKLGLPSN